MAEAVLVKTVVFDRHIYKPGGMAHRWMTRLCIQFEGYAKEAAPKRTGYMASLINADTQQVGERQVEGTIESPAHYSMWVIRGTGFPTKGREGGIWSTLGFQRREPGNDVPGGYVELWGMVERGTFTRRGGMRWQREKILVPLRGHWMSLPDDGRYPHSLQFRVSGQDPNNFLLAAWKRSAKTHSSLKGHIPGWLSSP